MFYGWYVVGGAFLLALWSWGLGFYGSSIYIVALGREHGWSISTVSLAITTYYLIGAGCIALIGDTMRRFGTHRVVAAGVLAMGTGVAALTAVTSVWQLYAAFAVMAFGWSCMSLAAINIVVAPWFEARRGVALSLALTGASCGGMVIAPLLLALVEALGFAAGIRLAVAVMLATLLPVALLVLRRAPADLGVGPDGAPAAPGPTALEVAAPPARRLDVLRTRGYWTISTAFALGLVTQVGVLTHLVAYLSPVLGTAGVGAALGITTAAAVVGRFPMGFMVDRMDRRAAASLNFLVQVVGLALLWLAPSAAGIYAGCALFGLGVGNVVSLPGLLVQREFAPAQFATTLSMIAATNQVTFAFAPGAIGVLRDATGSYATALAMCLALDLAAAAIVLGRSRRRAEPAEAGLALRPNCECCDRDLPPDSAQAYICSFECTFCRTCAEGVLAWRCPNCGGELVRRPVRPAAALARRPASTRRVVKPAPCARVA